VLSADTGLRFQREGSDGGTQLLEPRLYYLYVPYRNQDGLPIFDAGQPDYDFPRLFARNRFTGYDRVADANQLTTAATYRVLDPIRGGTHYSLSLGQIYRFDPSRVSAPGLSAQDAGSSDYIASGEWRISQRLSALSLVEWSPDTGRFTRNSASIRYRQGLTRADLDYRFRSGLLEQVDSSFSTPVSASFRVAGRMRYSLRDSRVIDSLVGLDYETCCYAIRSAYRRFIANSLGQVDNGVFFQLELKGLSNVGTGLTQMLPRDSRALGDD
jgi:LPS-assembly protein